MALSTCSLVSEAISYRASYYSEATYPLFLKFVLSPGGSCQNRPCYIGDSYGHSLKHLQCFLPTCQVVLLLLPVTAQ